MNICVKFRIQFQRNPEEREAKPWNDRGNCCAARRKTAAPPRRRRGVRFLRRRFFVFFLYERAERPALRASAERLRILIVAFGADIN